jgi:DNA-binding NtrC family response regulator
MALVYERLPIVMVDDEPFVLRALEAILSDKDLGSTVSFQDGREVLPFLQTVEACIVLLDLSMPHLSGEELLDQLLREYPDLPVIIVTASNEVDVAVRCIRAGAFDYVVKPVAEDRLLNAIRRAQEMRDLRRENRVLQERLTSGHLERPEAFAGIITQNAQMLTLFRYIEAVARSQHAVLITGETGVGKELIARAVHAVSGRKGEFVAVNVAGLDDNMFSDTLFGHGRGAFTGADHTRPGLIESATGGSLFLDEIGDLSPTSQVKLLRLLQENEYLPLGSDRPRKSDARVIVATHQDLRALQKEGRFRNDLYFRLGGHHVHVSPLRERRDDLPLLVDHLMEEAASSLTRKKPTAPKELISLLAAYHFPGNIRELQAMILDAVSQHEGRVLSLNNFKEHIDRNTDRPVGEVPTGGEVIFPAQLPTLRQVAEQLVNEAMRRAGGNQTVAARLLGVTRPALSKRLKNLSVGEGL